jgi:hypothetical protein
MKITGFTIIRNAIKYDYPVVEAITSILPICDEFVVAVGNSEDGTLALIKSINSNKIRIIETIWDDSLRKDGRVLAIETDKALAAISDDTTWAFYIQSDEIVHEKYHQSIKDAMIEYKDNLLIEGILFKYIHFYGSYEFIADSRKWYRNEIRVIRHTKKVSSYRDAQGFRKNDNAKLHVKAIDAYIFHYGWVKPPEKQQAKQQYFHKLWHDDRWMQENIPDQPQFDYSGIDSVAMFTGTHPEPMKERVLAQSWKVEIDPAKKKLSLRYRFLMLIEHFTGWRPGEYKNYSRID